MMLTCIIWFCIYSVKRMLHNYGCILWYAWHATDYLGPGAARSEQLYVFVYDYNKADLYQCHIRSKTKRTAHPPAHEAWQYSTWHGQLCTYIPRYTHIRTQATQLQSTNLKLCLKLIPSSEIVPGPQSHPAIFTYIRVVSKRVGFRNPIRPR